MSVKSVRKLRWHTTLAAAVVLLFATSCLTGVDMIEDDWVQNWDRHSASQTAALDWPVNLIFIGPGAHKVNTISTMLKVNGMTCDGSGKYLYLNDAHDADGLGPHYDADKGQKTPKDGFLPCLISCAYTGRHVRIYADMSDDRMWNSYWGFYAVGTTHWDFREGCDDESFGNSEEVEEYVAALLDSSNWGWDIDVCSNCYFMDNQEAGTIGKKRKLNNGWATVIYLSCPYTNASDCS